MSAETGTQEGLVGLFRAGTRGRGRRRGVQTTIALIVLVVIVGSAAFAPWVVPQSPEALDTVNRFSGPSAEHWFGTDELGRDLFSRVIYGGRIALAIAGGGTAVALVLGVTWGFIAAELGGWAEELLLRFVDVLMAIPIIMFALILVAAFGSSPVMLAVIAGLLLAPGTARIARSAVLTELKSDYCMAAVSVGLPRWRLLFTELMPNTAPTIIARGALVAADVIMIEASLSFLGLGVTPPMASWGTLLRQGYSYLFSSVSYVIFPGVVIFVAIWVFNVLGDELQSMLDPRSRS